MAPDERACGGIASRASCCASSLVVLAVDAHRLQHRGDGLRLRARAVVAQGPAGRRRQTSRSPRRPRSTRPTASCSRACTSRTARSSRSSQISPTCAGGRRGRGRALLPARGLRHRRHRARALVKNIAAGRRRGRRLDAHAAVHAADDAVATRRTQVTIARKIREIYLAQELEKRYTQGRDPRDVPQHRVLRRRRVRRRGGVEALLRQAARRSSRSPRRRCSPASRSRRAGSTR